MVLSTLQCVWQFRTMPLQRQDLKCSIGRRKLPKSIGMVQILLFYLHQVCKESISTKTTILVQEICELPNTVETPFMDASLKLTNFLVLPHTFSLTLKKPFSDQHQISPCNVNAYSTPEVMRIKDMITQAEFS